MPCRIAAEDLQSVMESPLLGGHMILLPLSSYRLTFKFIHTIELE